MPPGGVTRAPGGADSSMPMLQRLPARLDKIEAKLSSTSKILSLIREALKEKGLDGIRDLVQKGHVPSVVLATSLRILQQLSQDSTPERNAGGT